jgi:hypothetical protein
VRLTNTVALGSTLECRVGWGHGANALVSNELGQLDQDGTSHQERTRSIQL